MTPLRPLALATLLLLLSSAAPAAAGRVQPAVDPVTRAFEVMRAEQAAELAKLREELDLARAEVRQLATRLDAQPARIGIFDLNAVLARTKMVRGYGYGRVWIIFFLFFFFFLILFFEVLYSLFEKSLGFRVFSLVHVAERFFKNEVWCLRNLS